VEAKAVNNNGICLACYNGSLSSVIDADLNNKVSMGNFAALVSGSGISVKNNITTYPAGYITGFNVDTGTSFITAELLSSLKLLPTKTGYFGIFYERNFINGSCFRRNKKPNLSAL
jgi:hypothetical protein